MTTAAATRGSGSSEGISCGDKREIEERQVSHQAPLIPRPLLPTPAHCLLPTLSPCPHHLAQDGKLANMICVVISDDEQLA